MLCVGMMRCGFFPSLEVIFCKSDVCFSGAVVLTCDGGLVD